MDVLHTAIWVTDLETSKQFYEDILGLETSREFVGGDGVTNCFMTGKSSAEIQFKYDETIDVEISPGTMDHLAVEVQDVDATAERAVEEWGSNIIDGPREMEDLDIRIAFITDPEGYTIEIIQRV